MIADKHYLIKPMSVEDLEEVIGIESESFDQSWSCESFRSELEKNHLAKYLVACKDGKVIGYGGMWVVLDEAHLTTLAVEKEWRRRGVGKALLHALTDHAAESGAVRMTLEVRPSNIAARRLYEEFGFTVRGVRKKYYLTEDALFMIKEGLTGMPNSDGKPPLFRDDR
jgi:ribosomal-protein-alanine N-acetyltransferase